MINNKIVFVIIVSMLFPNFILSSSKEKLVITSAHANIRDMPSTKGKIITRAKSGDSFTIISKEGRWFKIKIKTKGKKFGFVHSSIVKLKLKNSKYKNSVKKKKRKRVVTKIGKKKKKKFPILLVAAGVTVAVVAAILILKKKEDDSSVSENNLAKEVYDSIDWKQVTAGDFKMGDNFNEGYSQETPVHTVYLDTFSMSKYEITFEQYDKFCEDTGRSKPSDEGWGRGSRPVINVSWDDAKAFCDWLSNKTGEKISLPTEAEWEKAARGTYQRRYPWGNSSPNSTLCNYDKNVGMTQPVGSHPSGKSPYGIEDMAGNVYEWCSDWYSSTYYSSSPKSNPTGPSSGSKRCQRGGSWGANSFYIRSAYRGSPPPSACTNMIGFRVSKH